MLVRSTFHLIIPYILFDFCCCPEPICVTSCIYVGWVVHRHGKCVVVFGNEKWKHLFFFSLATNCICQYSVNTIRTLINELMSFSAIQSHTFTICSLKCLLFDCFDTWARTRWYQILSVCCCWFLFLLFFFSTIFDMRGPVYTISKHRLTARLTFIQIETFESPKMKKKISMFLSEDTCNWQRVVDRNDLINFRMWTQLLSFRFYSDYIKHTIY